MIASLVLPKALKIMADRYAVKEGGDALYKVRSKWPKRQI